MRTLVKTLLRLMPFKLQLIRAGALLPPRCKSTFTVRLFHFLQSTCPDASAADLVTNLGISSAYRLILSKSRNSVYLFGTAEQYKGERGSLYLCRALYERCYGFLDIGAHCGYYTFFLKNGRRDGPPIYFFEPDTDLFSDLEANCRRNGFENVFGFKQGLGSVSGVVPFYVNRTDRESSSMSRRFEVEHQVESVEIHCVRFDDFVREHNLDQLCVKVDVEHAEFEFLEGARQAASSISFLIMEVLGPAISNGFINAARHALHMEAYYINDFRLEYSADGDYDYTPPQYNWLFCRHKPKALGDLLRHTPFTVVP